MQMSIETLKTCEGEARGLMGAYLKEVTTPFEDHIDWDYYRKLEEAGLLMLVIARDEGVMVGFMAYLIIKHPHSRDKKVAQELALYLHPNYRRGLKGFALIRFAEAAAKQAGAQYSLVTAREGNLGPLLEKMKYRPFETAYVKEL